MDEKSYAVVERALVDLLRKVRRERDYFRGRLIKAEELPAPNQHMVSAAISKLNYYAVEISEIEGELEMLREQLEMEEDTDQKEE